MNVIDQLRDIYQFNSVMRSRWVAEHAANIPARSSVLDVGAGAGIYRALFNHCEYFAQDFGGEPATMGQYTKLDYTSDILAIPVTNASFDVILCTEVLEHVPEPILALKEFSRILKGGGILLLTAPLGSRLHQLPFHFYGGYTPQWYERFLREAGFSIQSVERNRGFFSYFGQEGLRFSGLLDPRRTVNLPPINRLIASLIWLMSLAFVRLCPLVAPLLDSMNLEDDATVGYHVVAIRAAE